MIRLSIVVPVLNEQEVLSATLAAIQEGAPDAEVIVVDGGSSDASVRIAEQFTDQVLAAPRGRAQQQNLGAARSSGEALVFVHSDTIVPPTFSDDIAAALTDPWVCGGRFDIRFDDPRAISRLIGRAISLRSRLTRSATGDQAIFVRRATFARLGGFPEIPICEDLALMRLLKRAGRVACLRSTVTSSARRWQHGGFARTIVLLWTIKSLYLCGVAPERLARWYADVR
ncbi:MAG TPA: TIGR04283 family arsenosugar biosynthesis glycosyltransferase [Candidatus Binataceae bacterium]